MTASVGFTLLLIFARFLMAILLLRVRVRAPLPPANVGLPTPSLYCVSFARRVRGGGGGASGSDDSVEATLWRCVSSGVLSSSSVSWMITDEVDVPRGREPEATTVRLTLLPEGARWATGGVGRGLACVVSMSRSIKASVLRFALMP